MHRCMRWPCSSTCDVGQSQCTRRAVSHLRFYTSCWKEPSSQAGICRKGLSLPAQLRWDWGRYVPASQPLALVLRHWKGKRQSCRKGAVRASSGWLQKTRKYFCCGRNEITTIWDGWNSFGRCLGGGSLEGTAVPWQGDELHDLIGVFHLQYLWLPDYW